MIPTSGGYPHIMFKLRRSLFPLLLVSVALSTTGQADFCSGFAPHDAGPWINLLESANPRTPPQWSPDGAYLVFTKAFDVFEGDTYVVSADGSSLMMISARQGGGMEVDYSPSFSPDGARIVYSTSRHPVEGTGWGAISTSRPLPWTAPSASNLRRAAAMTPFPRGLRTVSVSPS